MDKHKCFNGLCEFYIDSDGRGLHCSMGRPGAEGHSEHIQDYDYDAMRLFRSASVRRLRHNCKLCKVKCFCYAFTNRERFWPIFSDIVSLRMRLLWAYAKRLLRRR